MKSRYTTLFACLTIALSTTACDEELPPLDAENLSSFEGEQNLDELDGIQDQELAEIDDFVEVDEASPGQDGEADTPHSNEFTTAVPTTEAGSRTCTFDNDCIVGACHCSQGFCAPLKISPPLPNPALCDSAPQRSCSSADDCRSGCSCYSGKCYQTSDVSPLPPDPGCHLPPPDDYEEDDSWQNWSAYTGTPQVHNFDRAFDRDWVAVYIHDTFNVRIETKNLQHNADTKLKVFRFDNYIKGELLGAHDDVGGVFWDPQRKRSRIDLELDEGVYLIKVINKGPADQFETQSQWPTYTLAVTAL